MGKKIFYILLFLFAGCDRPESEITPLQLSQVLMGDAEISQTEPITEGLPVDRPITLIFSAPLDPGTIGDAVFLFEGENAINISRNLISNNRTLIIRPEGVLKQNSIYRLVITNMLKSGSGNSFSGQEIRFKTSVGGLKISEFLIEDAEVNKGGRTVNVPLEFFITIDFSDAVDPVSLKEASKLTGPQASDLQFSFSDNNQRVQITGLQPLQYLSRYRFELGNTLKGAEGGNFPGMDITFYTQPDETPKFPPISTEELLTKVQEQTFRYFWDFAHENSGMARERNTSGNLVTVGGSGFGVMAIIVGIERGFISRQQGVARWSKIVDFLLNADRFHGVWPHWMNGNTGAVIPFSAKDNGGDLVETAFMIQGLLTVRSYLEITDPEENVLRTKITKLWGEVEWNWYTRGGQQVLYWHWSPEFNWEINLPIRGYNESLIVYILAASSPTFPISKQVYDNGWARQGQMINGKQFYQHKLPLGEDFGGPLFFAHYSYLGLDPRSLSDQYANYWEQNRNHSLINQGHCIHNPLGFVGYSENNWGLTASDNQQGYSAHSPLNDKGVITPTAALSSFPYTPEASLKALDFFYYTMGDRLWGEYGFYDAFNITEQWYADSYLAIDQGPIILMIENYRTSLLWDLFMKDQEVRAGLDKLNFNY